MSRDCVATGEGGSVDVATAPLPPAAAPPPPDRLRRTFMLKLPICSAGTVDLINTHHGSGCIRLSASCLSLPCDDCVSCSMLSSWLEPASRIRMHAVPVVHRYAR